MIGCLGSLAVNASLNGLAASGLAAAFWLVNFFIDPTGRQKRLKLGFNCALTSPEAGTHMKRLTTFFLTLVLFAVSGLAQEPAQRTGAADPFKLTLDHVASLLKQPLPDWRFHADVSHPEDPSLNDSDWQVMTVKPPPNQNQDDKENHWKGARVFRRWIEIPEKINGYAIKGSRVTLDLGFGSDANALITIFLNGSILFHGDESTQQPMLLTENAQPGQKFLIAARVDAGDVDTAFFGSQLAIEPPASRPDPDLIREEVLSARPLIAAYEDGKNECEQHLSDAVKAIDFSTLDKGDQPGFDASLQNAQSRLKLLDPWLKQFSIRAAGNSHIDMAWLWPWTETVEVVRSTFRSALARPDARVSGFQIHHVFRSHL
jgi:hypothetical protein